MAPENSNVLFVNEIAYRRLGVDSDVYPHNLPVMRGFDSFRFDSPVTFIVGENGSGKSTLIEAFAMALGFNAEGGTRNFSFSTYNSTSDLYRHLTVKRSFKRPQDGFFLRAESFYNVATTIENIDGEGGLGGSIINSYGGRSLHAQSHGESYIALMENRFGGNGIYLLDEPESALSPQRQYAMLFLIHELVKKNSQFIIATHSPVILAYPGAAIYSIDGENIKRVAYEECEQYQFTRDFLKNYKQYISFLD